MTDSGRNRVLVEGESELEPLPSLKVFANPSAGRGKAGRKIGMVRKAFARHGVSAEVVETSSAGDFKGYR